MKKKLILFAGLLLIVYLVVCVVLYYTQESLIFFPEKTDPDFTYEFPQEFEEISLTAEDGTILHSLLFKVENPKGLVFFLHGNAGSLKQIGAEASVYTDLQYDVFMLDYRGFGKSEGVINTMDALLSDNQIAYEEMLKRYTEENIILVGYSLGTGLASHLASQNKPKALILKAPYYSLTDMMQKRFALLPTFILKYPLESHQYLQQVEAPIYLFHGKEDKIIYYGSSEKLKNELKDKAMLFPLENQGHENILYHPVFQSELKNILKKETDLK